MMRPVKRNPFLTIEAMLCGLPCCFFATGGAFIFLFAAFKMFPDQPRSAAQGIVYVACMVWPLWQYYVLVYKTLEHERYRFGWGFWVAVPAALFMLRWCVQAFGLAVTAPVLGPIIVATLHFCALQYAGRRRESVASAPN